MIQTITGQLEFVKGDTTPKGTPKTSYKLNGTYFTAWAAPQANKGDTVTIEFEESQNGQYTNRTVKSISGGSAPQASTPAPTQTAPKKSYGGGARTNDPKVQNQIIDQNSNTNATEIIKLCSESEELKGLVACANMDELLALHATIASNLARKVANGDYHNEHPKFAEANPSTDDIADSDIPF